MGRYDGAEINAHWENAWPTDVTDASNVEHEFSPVLQAPVANLLGEPWYLEAGSPGGDYVTWLDLPGGRRLGVSPHETSRGDGLVRWAIGIDDANGNPIAIDHELLISAPPDEVVARVREFMVKHGVVSEPVIDASIVGVTTGSLGQPVLTCVADLRDGDTVLGRHTGDDLEPGEQCARCGKTLGQG